MEEAPPCSKNNQAHEEETRDAPGRSPSGVNSSRGTLASPDPDMIHKKKRRWQRPVWTIRSWQEAPRLPRPSPAARPPPESPAAAQPYVCAMRQQNLGHRTQIQSCNNGMEAKIARLRRTVTWRQGAGGGYGSVAYQEVANLGGV